ncbi:NlpC/P60 family protein [Streptomyces sp. NPDC059740]|uniref:C40 family peptidase n=1 Tax=Streptomyces sp. NPDC059740 TaxID=3346926 RepID=UPI00364A0292
MSAPVASHRKPRHRPLAGPTARTALTLALAGAASTTALEGTGHAAPSPVAHDTGRTARPGTAEVRARVAELYRQAEVATERYDGARSEAEQSRRRLTGLQDEAAHRTAALNSARTALGAVASSQYRGQGVDPTVQLALSSDPRHYLEGAALLDRVGDRQATAVRAYARALDSVREVGTRARREDAALRRTRREMQQRKETVQARLRSARALLSHLTAAERREVAAADTAAAPARASRDAGPRTLSGAPSPRAARAVAYAYAALGKPYVWGATGPSAFDCSGLTQAAWRAAGVSLPRTTYTQINVGRRVGRAELSPGDLVFFYSGVSHVGIYVGGGQMIHAPHPGAPVRLAPLDQMPFAGASRPV